jgi:hypothetical protein
MSIMVGATLLLLVPALMSVFFVPSVASGSLKIINGKKELEHSPTNLESLNKGLQSSLQFLAIIAILAGLATALIGNSIKDLLDVKDLAFLAVQLTHHDLDLQ